MVGGEGDVAGRVPVLGQHHGLEFWRKVVDEGHNLIAAGHGQRAAGAEIGLDVDHQKRAVFVHGWQYRDFGPGDIDRG